MRERVLNATFYESTSQDNRAPKAWNTTIAILRLGISTLLDLIFTTEGAVSYYLPFTNHWEG